MAGRPCPRCGGTDRFYLVAQPRGGGAPFWICNTCRHVEGADAATPAPQIQRRLTEAERQGAYAAYAAVAEWCATYLWTPAGSAALAYLRGRGLSDATIHKARLGFHPDGVTGGVGTVLWHRDTTLYQGARDGGLIGPQGQPKSVLRGTILFPYVDRSGRCTLLRGRALTADAPVKYRSPAGVGLYAGGTPTLYLLDWLGDEEQEVVVAEGEIKALLARQSGVAAVAQPGVGYRPDSYLEQLRHRTAIWCYDVEQRTDPFQLSPGERETLKAVAACTGQDLHEQIGDLLRVLEKTKKSTRDVDAQIEQIATLEAIEEKLLTLRGRLEAVKERHVRAKVVRLPRAADETKVEIDTFVVHHGAEAFVAHVRASAHGERWYASHAGGGFRFEHGGMWNGTTIANYQARIMETIYKSDGQQVTAYQRLALATPSGQRTWVEVPAEEWADDRKARLALRTGLNEGTFDDDAQHILRAVRLLSNQGDPPVSRRVYTCTGWEQVHGRWHFLAPDGAITSAGIETTIRSEIDPEASGNHYALCGPGEAAEGAAAWLAFLRGAVCPQPLALILAAQAALPLLHRFIGNSARPLLWLYQQTGALKTSLTRAAVLALYGPAFTAEKADGAPLPKWDASPVGLGLTAFYYRDLPFLIDDYKNGMITIERFKQFLHNYSESTGRTRGTANLTIARVRAARSIVFGTAEDIPGGDPGIAARLMAIAVEPGSVQPDGLVVLQRAGAAGHLAAFWRGFVQALAAHLDRHGANHLQQELQQLIRTDDAGLPGHKRAAGSLRQNRVAWLWLSRWLVAAQWLREDEAQQLNAAHLEARTLLADSLDVHQRESRPATIFLNVLNELIAGGDLVVERVRMDCPRCAAELRRTSDGWYCTGTVGERALPCNYHLPTHRLIGFECEDGVAIYAERAFREVSRVRNDQRQPFQYSSVAIWQQLEADGTLAKTSKGQGNGRYTVVRRNNAWRDTAGYGKPQTVLLLTPDALPTLVEQDDSGDSRVSADLRMRSMRSMRSNKDVAQQDADELNDEHAITARHLRARKTILIALIAFVITHAIKKMAHQNALHRVLIALIA